MTSPLTTSYLRAHKRFAVATFYLFLGLWAFFTAAYLDHSEQLGTFARFGLGSAATMWWYVDSIERRGEIPSASLWLVYVFGMVILPVHYFSTRGAARIGRFALHVVAMLVAVVVGRVAGFATGIIFEP